MYILILDLTYQPWWAIYAKNSAFFTETLYFSITIKSYFNISLSDIFPYYDYVSDLCSIFTHLSLLLYNHCITNVALSIWIMLACLHPFSSPFSFFFITLVSNYCFCLVSILSLLNIRVTSIFEINHKSQDMDWRQRCNTCYIFYYIF